jgi:hypothetical protein
VAGLHVPPDTLLGQRVRLYSHVAGLSQGQLQHQTAAVVCDSAHHVQPPGRPRNNYVILPQDSRETLPSKHFLGSFTGHLLAAGRLA